MEDCGLASGSSHPTVFGIRCVSFIGIVNKFEQGHFSFKLQKKITRQWFKCGTSGLPHLRLKPWKITNAVFWRFPGANTIRICWLVAEKTTEFYAGTPIPISRTAKYVHFNTIYFIICSISVVLGFVGNSENQPMEFRCCVVPKKSCFDRLS